jgi:hypothetical protein
VVVHVSSRRSAELQLSPKLSSEFYSRSDALSLDFENSDGDSKGSQEPDKQLTSPEVMARSNSSD